MTKKHFIAAARYIKDCPVNETIKRELAGLVIAMNDNPNFDKGRFLAACGLS